jgi:hypothetical protein
METLVIVTVVIAFVSVLAALLRPPDPIERTELYPEPRGVVRRSDKCEALAQDLDRRIRQAMDPIEEGMIAKAKQYGAEVVKHV